MINIDDYDMLFLLLMFTEGNESYTEYMEHLTIRIMELEEVNEKLLSQVATADLVETEKCELQEQLSTREEEMRSLESMAFCIVTWNINVTHACLPRFYPVCSLV